MGSTETVDGNGRFVFERRWGGFVLCERSSGNSAGDDDEEMEEEEE